LKDLDPKNPLKTMSLVVDIAQKQLGIYSVIGISEMVNCSTQNEVEMAAYLFQFYEMFHHESIPQTGPMQHDDMDVNLSNKRYRNLKGKQSRMDNPETRAILGTPHRTG
jgi:hypothetical protein